MRRFILLTLLFILRLNIQSQSFADKNHYLVDSLVWEKVSQEDQHMIDSCMKVFHSSKNDTSKLFAVIRIIDRSWDENVWHKYNSWMYTYSKKCLKKKNDKKTTKRLKIFLSSALNNKGVIALNKGQVDLSLKYLHESLALEREVTGERNIATSLSNIAFIYSNQGDIPKALDYYHQALAIQEKYKDSVGISRSFNNIGFIYQNLGDNKKALEYYEKSLKIRQLINDKMGIAVSYSNLAEIYDESGDFKNAIEYYKKGNVIYENIGNQQGLAGGLNNIGYIYLAYGDPDCKDEKSVCLLQGRKKALEYCNKSLEIQTANDDKVGMTSSLYNIAKIYLLEGNLSKANDFASKSYRISKELGYPENIRKSASLMKELNFNSGKYKDAYAFFLEEIKMRDSLEKKDNYKLAQQKQAKYFYDKIHESDSIAFAQQRKTMAEKQRMKDEKQQAEIELKETQQWFLFSGIGLLIIFLLFLYNRFKVIREQKKIIEQQKLIVEEKNREVLDSITYAKGIQEAILPTRESLNKFLKNGFVLYKPKDIVAGDFYWMEYHNGNLFIAVADCTGHGVPGAMVSVVCSGALNRSVKEFNLSDPAKILEKTREIVIDTFSKSDTKVNDGMDISLCCFTNFDQGKVDSILWAGANNPLWILRDSKMLTYAPDKQPVGRYFQSEPFTSHQVEVLKGDIIYLFSDGYADQFGGEKGKKFKYSSLKNTLIELEKLDPEVQCKRLEEIFDKWRGDIEQIDDICMIGIKI